VSDNATKQSSNLVLPYDIHGKYLIGNITKVTSIYITDVVYLLMLKHRSKMQF